MCRRVNQPGALLNSVLENHQQRQRDDKREWCMWRKHQNTRASTDPASQRKKPAVVWLMGSS